MAQRRLLLPLFLLLALGACTPGAREEAPELRLSVQEAPRVFLGGEAPLALEASLRGGQGGTLYLFPLEPPEGLTFEVPSTTLRPGDTVRLEGKVRASSGLPPGEHQVRLRAKVLDLTAEAHLALRALAPFSLEAPPELGLAPGEEARLPVRLVPGEGFSGRVRLEVTGAARGSLEVDLSGPQDLALPLTLPQALTPGLHQATLAASWEGFRLERPLLLRVTAPPPDFQVSLTPQSLQVERGGSAQAVLTLTPRDGFAGTVSLSLVGAPDGLSLSPQSLQVTGPDPVSQTLTLEVAPSVGPGTYALKVRGVAGGLVREADLALTVTAPPPGFALALSPASLTVQRGNSAQTTMTLVPQGGFAGRVSLSLVGAPSGITLSPTEVEVSGSAPVSQTLTLSASSATPTGTHRLLLRASGGDVTREAALALEVRDAPPPPGFALALSPSALTVAQGASGTTTLTLTPQNGFTGTVSLSLVDGSGNPVPGITLSPTSVTVSGSAPVTQTLTVGVASSVAPGTYALRVRGASGSLAREADLALRVVEPGYALALSPASPRAPQGGSLQVQVRLERQGFPGPVALSLEGSDLLAQSPAPDRIAWSFDPNPVTGDEATLTLQVGGSVPAGSYALTLRGRAQGLQDRTAALTLTVVPPPDFALAVDPADLAVPQGGSAQTTLTLTPQGGFTGTVGLSLVAGQDPVPQGLTLSPTSVSVPGTGPVSRTLTLSTSPATPTGTYRLKVRGTSGSLAREADLTLTVNPPPSFDLSPPEPASLRVPQGGGASFQATLTSRDGFQGQVSLSLVGAPQGLTLSPASVDLAPGASQRVSFTLSAASSTPTGTYGLTLRAASGSLARTQPLSVEVTPPAVRLQMDYEWGQVLLDRDLPLLAGKRAFLRVHLTADPPTSLPRPLAGTAYSGTSRLGDLSFTCPNPLPTATDRARLETTCYAEVPGSWVAPGLRVELRADPEDRLNKTLDSTTSLTLTPRVEGEAWTVWESVVRMRDPVTGDTATLSGTRWDDATAFLPLKAVRVRDRGVYTFPRRWRYTWEDWFDFADAVDQIAQDDLGGALDRVHHYAGVIPVVQALPGETWVGAPISGMAGVGSNTLVFLQSLPDGGTFTHELGHNLNLLHAPCRVQEHVDPNYPHRDGTIGAWNLERMDYESAALVVRTPQDYDIMSYCGPHGISRYHYERTKAWLTANPPQPWPPYAYPLPQGAETSPRYLFAAWVLPDGSLRVYPLREGRGARGEPTPYRLRARIGGETLEVPFLGEAYAAGEALALRLEALLPGEPEALEVVRDGAVLHRKEAGLAPQAAPEARVQEERTLARLTWRGLPYATLHHLAPDGRRTLLTQFAQGGEIAVSLEGLPPGGSFLVTLSDGLRVVKLTLPR